MRVQHLRFAQLKLSRRGKGKMTPRLSISFTLREGDLFSSRKRPMAELRQSARTWFSDYRSCLLSLREKLQSQEILQESPVAKVLPQRIAEHAWCGSSAPVSKVLHRPEEVRVHLGTRAKFKNRKEIEENHEAHFRWLRLYLGPLCTFGR